MSFSASLGSKGLAQASSVLLLVVACRSLRAPGPADVPVSAPSTIAAPKAGPAPTPSLAASVIPSEVIPAEPTQSIQLEIGRPHTEVTYVRPLSLQHLTVNSATFYFELSAPVEAGLVYWKAGAGPASIEGWQDLDPAATRHQIRLEDLEPGSIYEAAVAVPENSGEYTPPAFLDSTWDPVGFRLPGAEARALRIGVLGDSGFGQPATFELAREMATYDLDFVIHTGDLVYHADENPSPQIAYMEKLFRPLAPLFQQLPLYPVVGNHEYDAESRWEGAPYYYWAFPPLGDPDFESTARGGRREWYAFEYGSIQFIMLNSQTFFGQEGRAEQTAWVVDRLDDDRFKLSIPVFHVAPYSGGLHLLDGLALRTEWGTLFEAAGVPLVLSGHDHNYQRLQVGRVTYIVTGGGSETLYRKQLTLPESAAFARRTHFVLLTLTAGQIEISAIALGGEIIDQATILIDDEERRP